MNEGIKEKREWNLYQQNGEQERWELILNSIAVTGFSFSFYVSTVVMWCCWFYQDQRLFFLSFFLTFSSWLIRARIFVHAHTHCSCCCSTTTTEALRSSRSRGPVWNVVSSFFVLHLFTNEQKIFLEWIKNNASFINSWNYGDSFLFSFLGLLTRTNVRKEEKHITRRWRRRRWRGCVFSHHRHH